MRYRVIQTQSKKEQRQCSSNRQTGGHDHQGPCIDSELSSVAFTIANGGLTAGLKVSIFLTSAAIDLVRRGGQRLTHVHPMEPLAGPHRNFHKRGGVIWACTPCVKSRGYEQSDLLDGVIITGASVMHAEIKEGAATLSF